MKWLKKTWRRFQNSQFQDEIIQTDVSWSRRLIVICIACIDTFSPSSFSTRPSRDLNVKAVSAPDPESCPHQRRVMCYPLQLATPTPRLPVPELFQVRFPNALRVLKFILSLAFNLCCFGLNWLPLEWVGSYNTPHPILMGVVHDSTYSVPYGLGINHFDKIFVPYLTLTAVMVQKSTTFRTSSLFPQEGNKTCLRYKGETVSVSTHYFHKLEDLYRVNCKDDPRFDFYLARVFCLLKRWAIID